MQPKNKNIQKILDFRPAQRFYLSSVRHRGNRQLIFFSSLFIPLLCLVLFSNLIAVEWLGISLRSLVNLLLVITFLGLLWSALWMRTRHVQVVRNQVEILLPLCRLRIPWSDIRDVESLPLATLYPAESITMAQRQRLGGLYKQTGLLIRLRTESLGWKKWLLPWPMSGADPRAIFVMVHNWAELAAKIPEISNGRVLNQAADMLKSAPSAALRKPARSKAWTKNGVDLLYVNLGDPQSGRLIQQLSQKYQCMVAKTELDAVKIIRAKQPTLVIVDHLLADQTKSVGLIEILQRQQTGLKSGYLVSTQTAIDPEIELDLFEANVKEILNLPRGMQLTLKRIDFWFNWQGQVKNMARRNQELYGQNLFHRSELVRHGALKHFLPKDVAQEVMAGTYTGEAHRLRRQTVTVLFADIVGFTPLSSQLAPEVLAELLNEYLQKMTQVVVSHGGIVDKFIGDEVMALFGAPEQQPETIQVQNAFSAALAMVAVTASLRQKWEKRLASKLCIRIGINTGECTAGVFGSDSLRSYTVIGSPVNLAARLTSAAPPCGIVCCENSLKWVKMRTQYHSIGLVALKGIESLVEVFKIEKVLEPDRIR